MEDFGSTLPGRLSSSNDSVYRRLGEKVDLMATMHEALEAMTAGTHVLTDATTFSKGILRYKYKVRPAGVA